MHTHIHYNFPPSIYFEIGYGNCIFLKGPQQYFWTHMLLQELATPFGELESISPSLDSVQTLWLCDKENRAKEIPCNSESKSWRFMATAWSSLSFCLCLSLSVSVSLSHAHTPLDNFSPCLWGLSVKTPGLWNRKRSYPRTQSKFLTCKTHDHNKWFFYTT